MTGLRLSFAETAEDAPAAAPDHRVVVLDTTWTPGPSDRPDLIPLRRLASAILARTDPFTTALRLLDVWAEGTSIADRLTIDGVTYWFRIREGLWHWLHERVVWRAVLGEAAGDAPIEHVFLPSTERGLADVVRALAARTGARVSLTDRGAPASAGSRPAAATFVTRLARLWRPRWRTGRSGSPVDPGRLRALDERVTTLLAKRDRVAVLTHMGLRQMIVGARGAEQTDPNLGAVTDALADAGMAPILVGLGLDHTDDADWQLIEASPSLLPQSLLSTRWRGNDPAPGTALAAVSAAIDDIVMPLDLDGADVGPQLLAEVLAFAQGGLGVGLRQAARIERFLAEIRPGAVLLTHEGIRTQWLVGAARAGVPVYAVQHGIVYPGHPGYGHPRPPSLPLPRCTFVFGPYERQVLLDHGGYRPDEVEVSGSPRLDLDTAAAEEASTSRAENRAAVRSELGVAAGDRLLVVSTTFAPHVRRFHVPKLLEEVLGGDLPGIHVVFKQHPGETDGGPYTAILDGLAAAGGHPPPKMSVVREIDLLRLLRAADAHLGLHSTVLTDAVVAGTPNLVAVGEAYSDVLGYVAAGVAHPVQTVDDVRRALADPVPPDPAARAAFLAQHFRPGKASARIVARIRRDTGTSQIALRRASEADEGLLLAWANDPATRAASFNDAPIDPATHHRWLAGRLADTASGLWIALVDDRPIGQVRIEPDDAGSGEISTLVAAEARGKGLSMPMLEAAIAAARSELGLDSFVAYVRRDNAPSLALFRAAGFVDAGTADRRGIECVALRLDQGRSRSW